MCVCTCRTLMGGLTLWCTWLWRAFILQCAASSKDHSRDLEQGVGLSGHTQELASIPGQA